VRATGRNADMDQYKDKITGLLQEFERRLQVFSELEKEFAVFRPPITVKPSDMPADIKLEMIDVQCDTNTKDKFASWTWKHFDNISCQGTTN
jgi:hypothetical protein